MKPPIVKKDPFEISQFARPGAENKEGALRVGIEAPTVRRWVPQNAIPLLPVLKPCGC